MKNGANQVEEDVRNFYDSKGWHVDATGESLDAQLWEDLRPVAKDYIQKCRRRVAQYLPKDGQRLLDAASGSIQYPEYLEYSAGYSTRVCVDLSQTALDAAQRKIGSHGEFHCCSILELPLPDHFVDACVSLHTIYHIEKDLQEPAVRQLIRVTRPGGRIVIVYSNPDRLLLRLKKLLNRTTGKEKVLYFHPHPLKWWRRFNDECTVSIVPWRSLTAQESKRLIPSSRIGKRIFSLVLLLEDTFPKAAVLFGAYPMIVLEKK